jgi:hypothetical protein
MAAEDFANEMQARLIDLCRSEEGEPYKNVKLDVEVEPQIQKWCLMTHISRLADFLSNIALEPVKRATPSGPSRLVISALERFEIHL